MKKNFHQNYKQLTSNFTYKSSYTFEHKIRREYSLVWYMDIFKTSCKHKKKCFKILICYQTISIHIKNIFKFRNALTTQNFCHQLLVQLLECWNREQGPFKFPSQQGPFFLLEFPLKIKHWEHVICFLCQSFYTQIVVSVFHFFIFFLSILPHLILIAANAIKCY